MLVEIESEPRSVWLQIYVLNLVINYPLGFLLKNSSITKHSHFSDSY